MCPAPLLIQLANGKLVLLPSIREINLLFRASGAEKEPLLMNWQKEDFKRFAFPSDAVIPSSSSAAGMTEESKSALADMQAELN